MQRSTSILALAALSFTLASCYTPEDEPRPFAGGPRRSLDHPPRYGEGQNRYMDTAPAANRQAANDPNIDPTTIPPGANLTPPAGLNNNVGTIDPGVKVEPPAPNAPNTAVANPATVNPPAATAPPPAGDTPYARAVPGKPGFVYSPHEPGKILDVTGMRPGTKVKDPQTGAMFRVP